MTRIYNCQLLIVDIQALWLNKNIQLVNVVLFKNLSSLNIFSQGIQSHCFRFIPACRGPKRIILQKAQQNFQNFYDRFWHLCSTFITENSLSHQPVAFRSQAIISPIKITIPLHGISKLFKKFGFRNIYANEKVFIKLTVEFHENLRANDKIKIRTFMVKVFSLTEIFSKNWQKFHEQLSLIKIVYLIVQTTNWEWHGSIRSVRDIDTLSIELSGKFYLLWFLENFTFYGIVLPNGKMAPKMTCNILTTCSMILTAVSDSLTTPSSEMIPRIVGLELPVPSTWFSLTLYTCPG